MFNKALSSTALLAGFLASSIFVAAPALGQNASTGSTPAPFTLPELPYAFDALEPAIDAETMELHHGRHHQSFVDNLNAAAENDAALRELSLEEIVATAGSRSASVRNNAGGHWNHTFFWRIMGAEDERGEPSAELVEAIDVVFGSMDEFKEAFEEAGAGRFGSGWVWLIVDENDQLAITTTPNQDNPLMDVADPRGTPILGNDVWEHAYYLTYRNRRPEYLGAWWDVVNWEEVSRNYADALAQP